MRRTYNAAADARTTDCLEQARRLHKGITDIAKRLDEQKSHALTIIDLFTPSGETLRGKLKDYCVRLILKDPIGHARKTEELLWRKGFYDVVYAAKKLHKIKAWSDTQKALLSVHLAVGVGFYHHLILKLQLEYGLDLLGVIDFAYTHTETISTHARVKGTPSKVHTEEVKQCVIRLIHRSLVCLGDLGRYKLEIDPNWDPMIANRYYRMAIAIDPNIGMPHNQLGTISGNKNYGLDAVYHYMRCVLCTEAFEGAEGNLRRAIITNSSCADEKSTVHKCVAKLFSLLQLWDYDVPNSNRINQGCQDLLNCLENCLLAEQGAANSPYNIQAESSIESLLQNSKNTVTSHLGDDIVFKMVAICLMSISRLKNKESTEVQGVVAVTLAILSQLIQFTITRLYESLIDIPLSDTDEIIMGNITESERLQKLEAISEANINNGKSNSIEENKLTDLNDNQKLLDNEKENHVENGHVLNGPRKTKDKSKNLLKKLRRRKRRNSSDSDGSDVNHDGLGSSSDEINSDVSETEDDILSDENVLSDDAVSDDVTDDEGVCTKAKADDESPAPTEINGHSTTEESNPQNNEASINGTCENGEHVQDSVLKQVDQIVASNSPSPAPLTNNIESTFAIDENPEKTLAYVSQLKKEKLTADELLNILLGKEILASIKICCDWLRSNPEIIKICGKSSRTLLGRVAILLNLMNLDPSSLSSSNGNNIISSNTDSLKESIKTIPLPEDIDLKGLSILENSHKNLDWTILHKHKMNKREETILRVLKLLDFGHFLSTIEDARFKYDETAKLFETVDAELTNTIKTNGKEPKLEHPRGELMRHMGKLWLKAEVRALESRLRSRLISPYLVPDHEALAKHTPTLKRLVYAKKFIVVIPSVVVSALDEVKRVSGRAREATRWLEGQLKRGSRFLRAQRPQERLALPLIKGPRPKDKEAWLFFQIIECCHYLTQQTKIGLTTDAEPPVVTLLTGCNPDDKKTLTYSPEGLAKTAGLNIEYIESFHTKWKASSKSHG